MWVRVLLSEEKEVYRFSEVIHLQSLGMAEFRRDRQNRKLRLWSRVENQGDQWTPGSVLSPTSTHCTGWRQAPDSVPAAYRLRLYETTVSTSSLFLAMP